MSRGINRERQVRALLEAEGWFVLRAAGSFGVCDLVALREGELGDTQAMLVEVKSTRRPYDHFGPASRQELLEAGEKTGAEAWLCHWPSRRREPSWVPSNVWPEAKVAA